MSASTLSKPNSDTTTLRKRKGTLLVVDDEEGPRQSLEIVFKDDYDVLLAADGVTALDLAHKNKVDVALLDIRMTGMSGIDVLGHLKQMDPGLEVVMMTAFETTDTMRQALRLRACDYINKPFDLTSMRAAVANAMQRRTLEGEIHNNADKLQELLNELQDHKMQAQMSHTRGEIYASIIHDINGPITVISGFIQLLNQRIGTSTRLEFDDLEFVKDRLKTITRQLTNCIEISRRYLGFLRRQTDEMPQVGVNQLLSDLSHLVLAHPSLQLNRFNLEKLPQDICARMNGTDLIQVMRNLVVNALQCSSKTHSVSVEGRIVRQPLDLASFKDGPCTRLLNVENFDNTPPLLELKVSDDGPGIPAEMLPKIFEPYFTTKRPGQGTGLGLNIVQRLIREAKGALHVQTRPGQGTTFSVYLRAVSLPGNYRIGQT